MSEFALAPSDWNAFPLDKPSPGGNSVPQVPATIKSLSREFLARQAQPEMPPFASPAYGEGASLAAPPVGQQAPPLVHPSLKSTAQVRAHAGLNSRNRKDEAASSLEQACNALHRTHALLTQLKILGRKAPGVGPALHEAKHAYEQGLSNFRGECFLLAGEFAAASQGLSRAVCLVLARELGSMTLDPPLMPQVEIRRAQSKEQTQAANGSRGVPGRLSRIRWLLENGTLPSNIADQARSIASWSGELHLQARQSFRRGDWEGALELLQAAEAAAISAERICRTCYLYDG